MKKITLALLVASALFISGCTSESDANRALSAQGFTDIQYTGYNFFGCSKDDFFHTGFKAKNISGVEAEGTACSGLLFKNTTLRF